MTEHEKTEQVIATYFITPDTVRNLTILALRHGISRTEEARMCGSTLVDVQDKLDSGSKFQQLLADGDRIPLDIHDRSEDSNSIDLTRPAIESDICKLTFWASPEFDERMKGLADRYGIADSDVFSLSVDLRMRMEQLIDSGGKILIQDSEGDIWHYQLLHGRNPKNDLR